MGLTHEALLRAVCYLPEDYYPYGSNMDREADPNVDLAQMSDTEVAAYFERIEGRYHGDCSCGCRWFVQLIGAVGMDWGACYNPASHRCGLLTFEHQGCPQFEADGDDDNSR
ncbi:MAG: hypothetical protein OJF49_001041 [Ktedonobacterales bacterium]|jgi:hypothetical protein|nr:MAG: hypothetical protein OJF49_001041 [Ktedonobacterales bacterium]